MSKASGVVGAAAAPCASRAASRLRSSLAPAERRRAPRNGHHGRADHTRGGVHAGERLSDTARSSRGNEHSGTSLASGSRPAAAGMGSGVRTARPYRAQLESAHEGLLRLILGRMARRQLLGLGTKRVSCIKIHLRRRHPGRAISSCSWTRPSTTPRLRGCSAGSFIVTRTRCLLNSRGVSSRCRVVPACGVLEDGLESRPSPLAQRGRVQTPPLTDSGLERSSWGALPVGRKPDLEHF